MSHYHQHELLELQEHIRCESASAQICRSLGQMAQDQELRTFCEQKARTCETNAQRLMALFNHTH